MSTIDVRDRDLFAVDEFEMIEPYRSNLAGILIPRAEIDERVSQLAAEITEDHRSNPDFYPICVLKGAIRYFVNLLEELELEVPYNEGIVYSSRYHAGPASETPTVQFFDEDRLAGKDVLLVEDILDEGHTLTTLRERVEEHDPASITITTLFDTDVDRDVSIDPTYTGFRVPDAFFVGYGLDYDEQYRDLRHLGVLDTSVIQE